MCDRILVLRGGAAAAILEGDMRSEQRILQAAMGLSQPALASL